MRFIKIKKAHEDRQTIARNYKAFIFKVNSCMEKNESCSFFLKLQHQLIEEFNKLTRVEGTNVDAIHNYEKIDALEI